MEQFEPSLKKRLCLHSDASEACWRPAVDVYRDPAAWLCKFDLAGVRPEDVEVRVHGACLTVRGTRRDALARADRRAYSLEISYSSFERTVELPCDLEAAEVTSECRDGMLLVTIRGCEEDR